MKNNNNIFSILIDFLHRCNSLTSQKVGFSVAFLGFLCILKIYLFAGTDVFAQTLDNPADEGLVSIEITDQEFKKVVEAISKQAGILIHVKGKEPSEKKDVLMNGMPLSKAIAQIMRIYRVQNHAMVFNNEENSMLIILLGTSSQSSSSNLSGPEQNQGSASLSQEIAGFSTQQLEINPVIQNNDLPNIDEFAEKYHTEIKAKEETVVYPEGLSQKEIEAIGEEMMTFSSQD